ncbi:MAG: AI-2E family transporter [Nevskiaceae bacterium]|nr:MAG: AI-2E family transporter [Nevskiaceae bacterium]
MYSFKDQGLWLIVGVLAVALLWLLKPILAPFLIGMGLAYVGNPLVSRLQRRGLPRTLAVCAVFIAILVATVVFFLVIIPPLQEQLTLLVASIPDGLHWLQETALPALGIRLPRGVQLDADGLRKLIATHWGTASDLAQMAWEKVSSSGMALFTTVVNLALIPVVSFYLLRDWEVFIATLDGLIPPRHRARVTALASEADDVLGAFFRGQLLVMLALGLIYSVGLSIVGLKLALVIGLGAGLVSFVPYMGFITGFAAASIAILIQTGNLVDWIWVLVVFMVGQAAEGMFLTPNLVGERIGLHPVAVIFAVMAGGTLFGFVGVLLALPSAAVLAVLLRHLHTHWIDSRLYRGPQPLPSLDQTQHPDG